MINDYRKLLTLLRKQEGSLKGLQSESELDSLSARIETLSHQLGSYAGDFTECTPDERAAIRSTIEEILGQISRNQALWQKSVEANLSHQEAHQATRRFFDALQRRQTSLNRYDRSV